MRTQNVARRFVSLVAAGVLMLGLAAAAAGCGSGDDPAGSVGTDTVIFAVTAPTGPDSIESLRSRAQDYLTEADAGRLIETIVFRVDLLARDKVGVLIELTGDDASTLRWRFAEQPPAHLVEWYGVNGRAAFETDGLIGDPTTATKVLEIRAVAVARVPIVFELVERDPALRTGPPAKQLTFDFQFLQNTSVRSGV